ncbi:MAG TPA: TrbI/VirB10 family protein, partial [Polyangia bacterium]
FDRVIFPDQRTAHFPVRQVGAVDGAGSTGIPGDVNRHFALQFGAAVMLGMLDGLAAAVQAPTAAEPGLRDLVAARTSSNFATVVGGILQRYANVVPTISVPPGTPLKVFFAEDVRVSPYMRSADLSWMRR